MHLDTERMRLRPTRGERGLAITDDDQFSPDLAKTNVSRPRTHKLAGSEEQPHIPRFETT